MKDNMKPDASKKSEFFANLILLFFSVAFALLVLEVSLTIVNPEKPKTQPSEPRTHWAAVPEKVWTEHHPILGWYHIRNHRAVLETNELRVELHTNSAGFRGRREYTKERVPGVKRILFLGDSFVFGFGVEDSQVFTARVESEKPDYELINLGVAGYGIDQIYLSYRELGREYQSDYVFIGIFYEDFWRATRAFADSGHAKPYFMLTKEGELELKNVPVPLPYTLKENQFPITFERNVLENILENSRVYLAVRKGLIKLARNLRLIDPDMTPEWRLGRAILKQLLREIRNDGAEAIFFIMPSEYWATNKKPTSLARSLHRFSEKEQVRMLDTTPYFFKAVQTEGIERYFIPGDGHWSAEGHRIASLLVIDLLNKTLNK